MEIKKKTAKIFVNPNIAGYSQFKNAIINRFHLNGIKTQVIQDGSWHYYCHADDVNIE